MTGQGQNDVNIRLQFPSPGPLTPAAKSRTQRPTWLCGSMQGRAVPHECVMRQETLLTLARKREGSASGAAFRSEACCRTLRFHSKLLMLKAWVSFSLTYSLRITNTSTRECWLSLFLETGDFFKAQVKTLPSPIGFCTQRSRVALLTK